MSLEQLGATVIKMIFDIVDLTMSQAKQVVIRQRRLESCAQVAALERKAAAVLMKPEASANSESIGQLPRTLLLLPEPMRSEPIQGIPNERETKITSDGVSAADVLSDLPVAVPGRASTPPT